MPRRGRNGLASCLSRRLQNWRNPADQATMLDQSPYQTLNALRSSLCVGGVVFDLPTPEEARRADSIMVCAAF